MAIATEPELERVEALLLYPIAPNVDAVAAILQNLVGRAREAAAQGDPAGLEKRHLRHLQTLLDNALALRLGLARISVAGQAGYSSEGRAATGTGTKSGTTVAVV